MSHSQAELREGDIIFTASPFFLYRRVAQATGCPASHVGILFRDAQGRWQVAESRVPLAQYTPLNRFLRRSDGWFSVRRLKSGVNAAAAQRLRSACEAQMGGVYHPGFDYDSRRTYCSKFVHRAFREALGVGIGDLESFESLLRRRPGTPLKFWKAWFFGRIPWARRTVTPASQYASPILETVMQA